MTTNYVTATIGLTRTDRDADYVPAMDGYRAGAEQDTVTLMLAEDVLAGLGIVSICEALFIVTNAPEDVVVEMAKADRVLAMVLAADMVWAANSGTNHRSISKGDTVEYQGIVMECQSAGWGIVKSR